MLTPAEVNEGETLNKSLGKAIYLQWCSFIAMTSKIYWGISHTKKYFYGNLDLYLMAAIMFQGLLCVL